MRFLAVIAISIILIPAFGGTIGAEMLPDQLWEFNVDECKQDKLYDISLTEDGSFFFTGFCDNDQGDDGWLTGRIDESGKIEWLDKFITEMGGPVAISSESAEYLHVSGISDQACSSNVIGKTLLYSYEGDLKEIITFEKEGWLESRVLSAVTYVDGSWAVAGTYKYNDDFKYEGAFIRKVDDQGLTLFDKEFDKFYYGDWLGNNAVVLDDNENLYIHGSVINEVAEKSEDENKELMSIIKIDSKGEIIYSETYDVSECENHIGFKIALAKDGTIYAASSFYGDCSKDVEIIVKIDDFGNLVWKESLETDGYRVSDLKLEVNSENELIAAFTEYNSIKVIKYSSEASIVWIYDLHDQYPKLSDMAIDKYNNIYVVGASHEEDYMYDIPEYYDEWIIAKIGPDGDLKWDVRNYDIYDHALKMYVKGEEIYIGGHDCTEIEQNYDDPECIKSDMKIVKYKQLIEADEDDDDNGDDNDNDDEKCCGC